MKTIPQLELKTRIGELLQEVEQGEQFMITVDLRRAAGASPWPAAPTDPTFFADVAEADGSADLDEPSAR